MPLPTNDKLNLIKDQKRTEYALLLEERDLPFPVTVLRNGQPVSARDPDIPFTLQALAMEHSHHSYLLLNHFSHLLSSNNFDWPILIREEGNLYPLKIDHRPHIGRIKLNSCTEGVFLRRILDDGSLISHRTWWAKSWMVDFTRREAFRLTDHNWNLWEELITGGVQQSDSSVLIEYQHFQSIEVSGEENQVPKLNDFIIASDGKILNPEVLSQSTYKVDIKIDADDSDKISIHACIVTSGQNFPLDRHALPLFCEKSFNRVSAPLRTIKRRMAIYDAFFTTRKEPLSRERSRLIRSAFQGPDFRKRSLIREAKGMVEEALNHENRSKWFLYLDKNTWILQQRDYVKEVLILEILYRYFDVASLRDATIPGVIIVPRKSFFYHLPTLLEEFKKIDVELSLSGQTTVPATIEIKITTTAAGIDWFELHPEIRFKDNLLSEEEWRQALIDGLFASGGELHLLDANSLHALNLLAGMSPPKSKHSDTERLRIPRLHILDCIALRRLGATLDLAEEDARILHNLEHFSDLPPSPLPRLKAQLRDYQRHGYDWLVFLYAHKFGACLADDMGLGKTLQAISLLAALQQGTIKSLATKKKKLPHLVVIPPSLLFNWENEISRFAPDLRTSVYRGLDRTTDFKDVDVVLTTYDLVRRDIEKLIKIPFHVIIFDEAQAVKNLRTGNTAAARRLQGIFKMALTGTPLENHLGEFWSIIDLVLPGLLGDEKEFGGARNKNDDEHITTLIARTKPFVLRRTKEMISAELPPKIEMEFRLAMNEEQKLLYQQTVNELRGTVASAYRNQLAGQARMTALAALTRLRRLCLDPRLIGMESDLLSPKIIALREHLQELLDEGHSVLVFSQFTTFLDLIEPALNSEGIPWIRLDGSTPVSRRKGLVEQFQGSQNPQVFLLSLKAGGRGLNLTKASYVIHLDPWWNPAVENQASDRAHRIGQTRTVTVIRLLMEHSVEEKMMMLKSRKERLFKALLEEGRDAGDIPLSREDFEFLIGGELS